MWEAVNIHTGKKVKAIEVFKDATYQQEIYNKWVATEKWCEDFIKNWDNIKKDYPDGVEVIYVNRCIKKSVLGNKFETASHFRIKDKDKKGIETIPYSREHKMAEMFLQNLFIDMYDDVKFLISSSGKLKDHKTEISLKDLAIDLNNVCVNEVLIKNTEYSRVADLLIPFSEKHPLLGSGIVIEIQFSPQSEKTRMTRTEDRALLGYSTCWLFKDDFQELNKDTVVLNEDAEFKVSSYLSVLQNLRQSFEGDIKKMVQKKFGDMLYTSTKMESDFDNYIEDSFLFAKHCALDDFYDRSQLLKNELKKELTEDSKNKINNIIRDLRERNEFVLMEVKEQIMDKVFGDLNQQEILESVKKQLKEKVELDMRGSLFQERIYERSCPRCGNSLKISHRRIDNKPFIGCYGFKEGCRYMESVPKDLEGVL